MTRQAVRVTLLASSELVIAIWLLTWKGDVRFARVDTIGRLLRIRRGPRSSPCARRVLFRGG